MIKKTYIPGKPRNPKLGTATGTSGVGKQVAGSSHEHYNKGVLDSISQSNIDVLNLLSVVDGNIKVDTTLWATGGLSALGLGEDEGGGGGGGGAEMLDSWANYTPVKANYYVPASLLVPFRSDTLSRLESLEAGGGVIGIEIGGRNYFIKKTQSVGYINHNDGNLGVAPSHIASDFIEVSPSEKYIFSPKSGNLYFPRIAFYNATKTFISGLILNGPTKDWQIEIPSNTSYVRVSSDTAQSTEEFQFEKGNKKTDWSPAPEDQVSDWSTTDVTSFSYIKNKPTTLAGYGITDAVTLNTAQTITGAKTFLSDLYTTGNLMANTGIAIAQVAGTGGGLSLYANLLGGNGVLPDYGLAFSGTALFGTHGAVTGDWATYFTIGGATNRGWVFKRGVTSSGNAASISSLGVATFNGSVSTPKVDFGNGFTIEPSGTELVFKYNGVIKQRMLSTGTILGTGGVTALATN